MEENKENKIDLKKNESSDTTGQEVIQTGLVKSENGGIQPPAEIKNPDNKNKKLMIGGVILVALIAIFIFASSAMGGVKSKFTDAFNSTFSKNSFGESSFEKATQASKIFEKIASGSTKQKGYIQLNKLPSEELNSMLKDSGITFEGLKDIESKKISGSIGIMYSGAELAKMFIYADEENAGISIPVLFKDFITIPLKDMGEKYNQSIFAGYGQFPYGDDFDIDLFEVTTVENDYADDMIKSYLKTNGAMLAEVTKNVEFTKLEDKAITIDGKEENCKGYSAVVKGEDIKKIIASFSEFISKDEEFDKFFTEIAQAQYTQYNLTYGSMNGNITEEQYKTQMKMQLALMFSQLQQYTIDDEKFEIYVGNDKRIKSMVVTSGIGMASDRFDYIFELTLGNSSNPFENFDLKITMTMNGEEVIINFSNDSVVDGDTIRNDGKMLVNSGYEKIMGTLVSNYNTKNGEYDFTLKLGSDVINLFDISSKGIMTVDNANNMIAITIDEINLAYDDGYGLQSLQLEGSYSIEKLNEEVTMPVGNMVGLFDLNQNAFGNLILEIQGNLQMIQQKLAGSVL